MVTTAGLSLLGVSLSGAEYGNPTPQNPGRAFTNYVLPNTAEIDYYAAKGLNIIRLPFSWERMQAVQNGALNATYLQEIDQVVSYANAKGLKVDLDLHNYGKYYGKAVGGTDVPAASLENLWTRLAGHFASSGVLFGLMNEPGSQTAQAWAPIAARLVTAIRAAGATTQEILVPGGLGDGASSWVASGNAAALAAAIVDPNHNFAYEVHQYFDANESGTSTAVVSPTIGVERLASATQWAEATGSRLFLGEFAAASDAASLATLTNTLAYMAQHAGAWQGGTYWAGGQWWGTYPFSIEPSGGADKPQMAVLTRFEQATVDLTAPSNPASPLSSAPASSLPGFDSAYYLLHNPDVTASGTDPTQHFLAWGWHEGRNPNAMFDTRYYLAQNPDVAAAGLNPLLHYQAYGSTEGRLPSLLFDPAKYLSAYADVAAAKVDPLLHYTAYGQAEGRSTFLSGGTAPADLLIDAAYYDAQLGASLIPGGAAAAQQASYSYAHTGWMRGLNPSSLFDTSYYLSHNPDVSATHTDPLLHYETYGWREGRDPSAGFSGTAYLAAYSDVRAAGMDPLLHYVAFGRGEGRLTVHA